MHIIVRTEVQKIKYLPRLNVMQQIGGHVIKLRQNVMPFLQIGNRDMKGLVKMLGILNEVLVPKVKENVLHNVYKHYKRGLLDGEQSFFDV